MTTRLGFSKEYGLFYFFLTLVIQHRHEKSLENTRDKFLWTECPGCWNIRSQDYSFPGTFVPGTLDLSCRRPFVHLSAVHWSTYKEGTA